MSKELVENPFRDLFAKMKMYAFQTLTKLGILHKWFGEAAEKLE